MCPRGLPHSGVLPHCTPSMASGVSHAAHHSAPSSWQRVMEATRDRPVSYKQRNSLEAPAKHGHCLYQGALGIASHGRCALTCGRGSRWVSPSLTDLSAPVAVRTVSRARRSITERGPHFVSHCSGRASRCAVGVSHSGLHGCVVRDPGNLRS